MLKRPLAEQKVHKRPKLRNRIVDKKVQVPNDTEAENAALQVYYELLEKNHWRPLVMLKKMSEEAIVKIV